ncbi:UNVERIFIED_CONTAM: hypothetical protein K2H54_043421 [Gekko kuhli]
MGTKQGEYAHAFQNTRSTKGASKARRDQINAELQNLRSLLPISEQEKERLSYLHTMALVCLYMRETQLFPPGSLTCAGGALAAAIDPELLSSLPGFILALTANGKLAYISENVSNFLGFSVVELLAHGDSIFDLLNSTASGTMEEKLCFAQQHPGTVAYLPENGDHTSQKLSFQSLHTLDMKIAEVIESVIYHLGYHKEELINQSWYSLLHPEDVCSAAELHKALGESCPLNREGAGRNMFH